MGESKSVKDWLVRQFPVACLVLGAFWLGGYNTREATAAHVQFEERLTKAVEAISNVMTDLHADVNRCIDIRE